MPRKGRARRFREARELKQGFDDGLFREGSGTLADTLGAPASLISASVSNALGTWVGPQAVTDLAGLSRIVDRAELAFGDRVEQPLSLLARDLYSDHLRRFESHAISLVAASLPVVSPASGTATFPCAPVTSRTAPNCRPAARRSSASTARIPRTTSP